MTMQFLTGIYKNTTAWHQHGLSWMPLAGTL